MQEHFALDDQAKLALEVAKHAALANGDSRCGTEYLLYGLVATARGDIVELIDLFALNTLRVDRAIERSLESRPDDPTVPRTPVLTERALVALCTPRLDQSGPTGPFELLHGLLLDDNSGACDVLRDLGVKPAEARRLVSYGIRHLTRGEIDDLLATLDRRVGAHRPWWGPDPAGQISSINTPIHVGSSDSARIDITALGTDGFGVGFTLTVRSLRTWVLPPVFAPEEALIPGQGASYNDGPDFLLLQIVLPDGTMLDNRSVNHRFKTEQPDSPRLLRLGQRDEQINLYDRRQHDQHVITGDWWIWPQPTPGPIEVRIDWPAEAFSGSAPLDMSTLTTGDPR